MAGPGGSFRLAEWFTQGDFTVEYWCRDEAGFVWNWSQSSEIWVKSEAPIIDPTVDPITEPLQTITLDVGTAGASLSGFTAGDTLI